MCLLFMYRELHLEAISATRIELWNGRDMSVFRSDGRTSYTASGGRTLSRLDDGKYNLFL